MYNIFGVCVAQPQLNDGKDNWGNHFHKLHKDKINWHLNFSQSNLQIAVHVMLMSKPDCINIVQLVDLHRTKLIDSESSKTYDLGISKLESASWVDKPSREINGKYFATDYKTAFGGFMKVEDTKFFSEKDENYAKTYAKRNYIPQSKWELQLALTIIDKHAQTTGHDIRIVPHRHRDHTYNMLGTQTKRQLDAMSKHYNHNRLFWYNDKGAFEYKEDDIPNIVENHLQPWLDRAIITSTII